jgi:hypothetical protein
VYIWKGHALRGQTATNGSPSLAELPSGKYAYNVSVYNRGDTNDLLVLCETEIADAVEANMIPVPPGQSFSFSSDRDAREGRRITKICVSASADTTTYDVAFS